jgi:hypothetical protein
MLTLAPHNVCDHLAAAAPSPTLPRKREREKKARSTAAPLRISQRLDAGVADDRGPACDLGADPRRRRGRRIADRLEALTA